MVKSEKSTQIKAKTKKYIIRDVTITIMIDHLIEILAEIHKYSSIIDSNLDNYILIHPIFFIIISIEAVSFRDNSNYNSNVKSIQLNYQPVRY